MTRDEFIKCAFDKAWNNECEGTCTDDDGVEQHQGECKVVHVTDPSEPNNDRWHFSYCNTAIETDEANGFSVRILNVAEVLK